MQFSVSNNRVPARKLLALISALSTCFIPFSLANAQEDKSLPPVVVTASRVAQLQSEALPHTTVITAEDIRNRQATDLPMLLRQEAGIEIVQNGGPGTQSSVFMRGASSSQNLILIDGVPIRGSSGGAAELEHILPNQIDRIEIVRGNVSAIYGSGAIGGVIQIFTKRGDSKPIVNLSAEAGSRGTTKLAGGISGQSGDTRYMLSATRFKTNGFSAISSAQYPSVNADDDGDRNISLAASLSQEWSKGNELGVRLFAYDAKVGYDSSTTLPTEIATSKSKQHTTALFSRNRFSPAWLSTVTFSHSEAHNDALETLGSSVNAKTHYKSDNNLLQWVNEVMLSQNWMMTVGVDTGEEKADVFSHYPAWNILTQYSPSRLTSSAYAGLNGKHGAHSMQLNLRRDHVEDAGSDTTHYLGYGYALTPSWKLVASTSTAFHAPTLVQVYAPGLDGNLNLKAERARSHEVGVQYAAAGTLLRATIFDTRTNDLISYVGQTPVNINKASNRGLELSATSRIADIDVKASLTLQDPKDDTTDETLQRRAKTMASLALSKKMGDWRIGGDVQYMGHRPDASYDAFYNRVPQELPSFWLVNVNARYQVSKELSLFGRIENLFDREYQMAYGYDQPSRGVFVGVNWQM